MSQIFKTLMAIFTVAFMLSIPLRAIQWFSENDALIRGYLVSLGMNYNAWFEVWSPFLFFIMIPGIAISVVSLIHRTFSSKKSYEDAMQVYDNAEVKAVILSEKLSLDELLTDDGEIPDHLLKHSDKRITARTR